MASLSKIIGNTGPVDLVIDYIGSETDMQKKGGGSYKAHKIILKSSSTGETFEDKIFPNQIDYYKVGDMVHVDLNDKGYVAFSKVESGEPRNNYKEVKKERAMAPVNMKIDNEDKAKQTSIILQAFTKSWIEGGIAKTPEDACKLAMDTYLIHRVDVARLLND